MKSGSVRVSVELLPKRPFPPFPKDNKWTRAHDRGATKVNAQIISDTLAKLLKIFTSTHLS